MEVWYVKCASRFELFAELPSAVLMRILELCHQAVVTGVVTTKRSPSLSSLFCSLHHSRVAEMYIVLQAIALYYI